LREFSIFSFLTVRNAFLELANKFAGNCNTRLLIGSGKRGKVLDWEKGEAKSISLGEVEFKYFLLTGKHFY
jgi:hypothetical protein